MVNLNNKRQDKIINQGGFKMKKYEILMDKENTIEWNGRVLHRIKALKDFGTVKKDDIGGYIEKEYNLSHDGDCWIYDGAKAMDSSRMYDDSRMYDESEMHDNSKMYGDSRMYDYSIMYDYSEMHNMSKMHDNSVMYDNSKMYGDSELNNSDKLYGKLVSKVDNFIEMQNPRGKLVTCVKKGDKILYNIDWQDEIDEQTFKDRIENEGGGLEKHPHRKYYYKIIGMSKLYFNVKYIRIIKLILDF